LRRLEFDGRHGFNSVHARQFALLPWLGGLRELRLSNVCLDEEGTQALLSSPHLTRLTSLGLWRAVLPLSAPATLAAWHGLGRLRSLDLSGHQFMADDLRPLVDALEANPLIRLNLSPVADRRRRLTRADLRSLPERLGCRLIA
jgi:hypothetical protein